MHRIDKVELCLIILLTLMSSAARADDERFRVDLTAGRSGLSMSDLGPDVGRELTEGFDLGLRGVRLAVDIGSSLKAYVSTETDPWYGWARSQTHMHNGLTSELSRSEQRELETFEAGLERRVFDRGQWTLTPRVGIVRLELDETSEITGYDRQPGWSRVLSSRKTATGHLWGVSAELEVGWRPVRSLQGVVRIGGRWTNGPVERRQSTSELVAPLDGPPEQTVVDLQQTDTEGIAALTVELGAAWNAVRWLVIEAGWQHRDWRFDDASARTDSPYLRLGFRL